MSQFALYHPNKSSKGFAISFKSVLEDKAVYIEVIRQSGWNDQEKIGSFKGSRENPESRANVKLSNIEVGAFLDCLDKSRAFSTFHDHDKKPKKINFNVWEGEDKVARGYSLGINITDKEDSSYKNSFYFGFNFAEGRVLREFLITSLQEQFRIPTPRYAKDANKVSFSAYVPTEQAAVVITASEDAPF